MNNSKQNRGRHRNNARRSNPSRQNFDSNGPGIRIRGNATQVYEKYIQLARDAQGAGDRVMAENMLQHAEHYFRILNDTPNERPSRPQHNDQGNDDQSEGDISDEGDSTPESSSDAGQSNDGNGNGGGNGGGNNRGRGRRSNNNNGGGNGGNTGGGRGSGRGRRSNRNADADGNPVEASAESDDSPAAVADGPAQQELSITAE